MYLLYNDRQKWYYQSRQTPDDVLMIKIYDSSQDVKAISIPYRHHSSTSIRLIHCRLSAFLLLPQGNPTDCCPAPKYRSQSVRVLSFMKNFMSCFLSEVSVMMAGRRCCVAYLARSIDGTFGHPIFVLALHLVAFLDRGLPILMRALPRFYSRVFLGCGVDDISQVGLA